MNKLEGQEKLLVRLLEKGDKKEFYKSKNKNISKRRKIKDRQILKITITKEQINKQIHKKQRVVYIYTKKFFKKNY